MFSRILVPVDFSDASLDALRMAVRLAAEQGAALTVLHVVSSPHVISGELDFSPSDAAMWSDLNERLREVARKRLEEVVAETVPEEMNATATVREGYGPAEILSEIEEGEHDLVVMGPHGHTGIRGALLGSVTRRVLGKCTVPLLLAR